LLFPPTNLSGAFPAAGAKTLILLGKTLILFTQACYWLFRFSPLFIAIISGEKNLGEVSVLDLVVTQKELYLSSPLLRGTPKTILMKPTKPTIVIADDQQMVRELFVMILKRDFGYEICGEAGDGIEALRQINFYKPDILLLDIHMPRMNGLQMLEELRKKKSAVRTLIVSQDASPETMTSCMKLGAYGFVSRYHTSQELPKAIDTVMQGDYYFCPITGRDLLREIIRLQRFEPHYPDTKIHFDEMEMQVLYAFARQLTSDEAAGEVNRGTKAIEAAKSRIVSRLKVYNFFSVFIYACQQGIINIDEIPLRKYGS
jgi:DNA-binding NarL/FixJ family response regulator